MLTDSVIVGNLFDYFLGRDTEKAFIFKRVDAGAAFCFSEWNVRIKKPDELLNEQSFGR